MLSIPLRRCRVKRAAGTLVALCLVILPPLAAAADYGQFGPFDYYDLKNTPENALPLVERAHFGPKTKKLALDHNWCFYWGDLDYTLRAFPNHPGALMAMAEYLEHHRPCTRKRKEPKTLEAIMAEIESGGWRERNADYYFDTAIKFRPQYAETHILYGKYLAKSGRLDEALARYAEALKLEPNSADAHYYLGLLYLEKGNFDKAKFHAQKAYSLGQQLPDLREKLIKAGMWESR